FVSRNFGRDAFVYLVYFVLGAVVVFLLYVLIFRLKVRAFKNYFWLIVVAVLYIYCINKFRRAPAETVHFLEYGLLGILLFRALSHKINDKSIYLTAVLIAVLVGIADEFIQWITPGRFWEFRDVGLNALSGSLALFGLWTVVNPRRLSGRLSPKSVRLLCSVLAVSLIALGLCASNTPEVVAAYTEYFPRLSFLNREEAMSEFGYKYKDPEIGVFFSRLPMGKIEKTDKEKGKEYGGFLTAYSKIDYQDFLKRFNPVSNPFLYEVRIHIFRRDTYWRKGKRAAEGEREKAEFYFTAYMENLILEKYFGHTLENSVYMWEEERKEEIRDAIEAEIERLEGEVEDLEGRVEDRMIQVWGSYKSPVSSELFTAFTLGQMWLAVGVVLVMLFLWGTFPKGTPLPLKRRNIFSH
ncbi:MAG: VanZ family protein, partial [Acidobacteriota bacterium]